MMHSFRSNADHTRLISKSIFITNFPDSTTSKDLWNLCQPYGTVVDVFIPNRKSKSGKRFAFIRFIKVDNIDRLVGNLCTLWIGRFHLHANVVRFDRPPKYASRSSHPVNPKPANHVSPVATSFVSAVKGNSSPFVSKPALVLDESCLVTRDLGYFVMGEVLQFSSINNLRVILSNEGFPNAHIVYLGGLNAQGLGSKAKKDWIRELITKHKVSFLSIQETKMELISAMDVKQLWGNYIFDHSFSEALGNSGGILCTWDSSIFHKEHHIISDNFVALYGTWIPNRLKLLVISVYAPQSLSSKKMLWSYISSLIVRGDNADEQRYENEQGQSFNAKEVSKDPFNIYDLLNKTKKVVGTSGSDTSLPYPPGFTPDKSTNVINEKEVSDAAERVVPTVNQTEGGNIGVKPKGGRILFGEIIDEMNKLKLLVISVYAPQSLSSKKMLWSYISSLIVRWNGECLVMGDFNEVRYKEERWGSTFNAHGANVFNTFISSSGLVDVQLEGYTFTLAHPSASKMSKLDRFFSV
ncbi:RNA-directed DNA polymerase, eukaryota [Tanacetum coccineum]